MCGRCLTEAVTDRARQSNRRHDSWRNGAVVEREGRWLSHVRHLEARDAHRHFCFFFVFWLQSPMG